MTAGKLIRSAVSIGWLLNAVLLERILTLGAITDTSQVTQDSPPLLAVGALLIVLSISTAIAVVVGLRAWPMISLTACVALLVAGVWLRLDNGDDSGAAIVVTTLLIAIASLAAIRQRRRGMPSSSRPPGS